MDENRQTTEQAAEEQTTHDNEKEFITIEEYSKRFSEKLQKEIQGKGVTFEKINGYMRYVLQEKRTSISSNPVSNSDELVDYMIDTSYIDSIETFIDFYDNAPVTESNAKALSALANSTLCSFSILESLRSMKMFIGKVMQFDEFKSYSFDEIRADTNPMNGSIWNKILDAAAALAVEASERKGTKNIESFTVKKIANVLFPIDKLTATVCKLTEEDANKKITIKTANEKDKRKRKDVSISYSIGFDFDDLPEGVNVKKEIEPTDLAVMISAGTLWNGGSDVVSLTQIHKYTGATTRPGPEQLQNIYNSIQKMMHAPVEFNNEKEVEAKYKYPKMFYSGNLLPCEMVGASFNGKLSEAAVHFFREPPLIEFARKRNQITEIPIELLQAPLNKTNDNITLQNYLIRRIAHAKNEKRKSEKMLISKICENCGISATERMKRKRLPDKIETFLKHFGKCEYICGYSIDTDSVIVYLDEKALPKSTEETPICITKF